MNCDDISGGFCPPASLRPDEIFWCEECGRGDRRAPAAALVVREPDLDASNVANSPRSIALPSPKTQSAEGLASIERAAAYIDANLSAKTRADYAHDWKMFEGWCTAYGHNAAAADDAGIAVYLAWMADQKQAPSSIERAWHGIYWKLRQFIPDTHKGDLCRKVLRGIRRTSAHRSRRKASLVADDVGRLLPHCGAGLIGLRNRALLLVGFAGGFRRSELARLDVGDLQFREEGVRIALRRSKTDQEGRGMEKGLVRSRRRERCPVAALLAWLEQLSPRIDGTERSSTEQQHLIKVAQPVFPAMDRWGHIHPRRITPRMVAHVVKAACRRAGLDAANYAGHSLRAGLVTQAALSHKSLDAIMRQTGHRSVDQVMEYIRHATIFDENASEGLLD
jgi:integrase